MNCLYCATETCYWHGGDHESFGCKFYRSVASISGIKVKYDPKKHYNDGKDYCRIKLPPDKT